MKLFLMILAMASSGYSTVTSVGSSTNRTPGSIDMTCIKKACGHHYKSCNKQKKCSKSIDCVLICSKITAPGMLEKTQRKYLDCLSKCYVKNKSKIFRGLNLCAQAHSCIQPFLNVTVPKPAFIESTSLSALIGTWNIAAGVNEAFDRYNNATLTFKKIKKDIQVILDHHAIVTDNNRKTSFVEYLRIVGNIFEISKGIYSYQSKIANGFWYNLGGIDKESTVIYYSLSNHLSNWYGGYVLTKNKKITLTAKDMESLSTLLMRSFAIPRYGWPNATILASGNYCNPFDSNCQSPQKGCCLMNFPADIQNGNFRCAAESQCAAYPHINISDVLHLNNTQKFDLGLAIDSFKVLNIQTK